MVLRIVSYLETPFAAPSRCQDQPRVTLPTIIPFAPGLAVSITQVTISLTCRAVDNVARRLAMQPYPTGDTRILNDEVVGLMPAEGA